MTATVLLRCAGPMQSWGTRSRFDHRDTEREPSKSGILGLVAAALGRPRSACLADLSELRMSTRIDAPGTVLVDFQTALDVAKANSASPGTVLSHRYYLADASFLVALEGQEHLCAAIRAALARPRWPLFLGRKSYVPGLPIAVAGGAQAKSALSALRSIEWPREAGGEPVRELPAVVECVDGQEGDARLDVPISFAHDSREFGARRVRRIMLQPAEDGSKEAI